MSTIALNKLLDYILSLSLSDNNKDWLAGKIIESKANAITETEKEQELFSMFGAWSNDPEIDVMEKAIREGRTSGITRNVISFDEV